MLLHPAKPKTETWMITAFIAVIVLCMFVHIFHPYLWGPDETREAEVARELLRSGDYMTTTFDSLPYVEKPPLYYNLVALSFRLSGGLYPGAARSVSAILALLMLGSVFFLAKKRGGFTLAATAVLLCVSMPQFYRTGLFIILDIGVGAFLTMALSIYGYMILVPEKRKSNFLFSCFYLCIAAAFLTKGVITIIYLGAVFIPFFFLQKKSFFLRLNWTVLFFFIPVAVWFFFFYQKGGIYYLHEHFINNTVGRLLHKSLSLKDAPKMISDVGNSSPFYFYLKRWLNMFSVAGLIAIAAFIAYLRSVHSCFQGKSFLYQGKNLVLQKISVVCEYITAPRQVTEQDRCYLQYLFCGSFAPIIVFSLPAAKEVTYILPAYASIALFSAEYLLKLVPGNEFNAAQLTRFLLLPLAAFALITQVTAGSSLLLCFILCGCLSIIILAGAVSVCLKKQWRSLLLLSFVCLIGGIIIGNIPEVIRLTRMNRKCYNEFAMELWRQVGTRSLYICGGDESIRGAVPFFGDRDVTLVSKSSLPEKMADSKGKAILIAKDTYENQKKKVPELQQLAEKFQIIQPDFPHLADTFLLFLGDPR